MRHRYLFAVALLGAAGSARAQTTKVTPLLTRDLTDLAGREGAMMTVEYAPGAQGSVHRHDAHVFVYVLEGEIVMQVRGGEPVTLRAGETFYEGPDDVHTVGRNASATRPAKFLAVFVKKKGAPVSTPVTK